MLAVIAGTAVPDWLPFCRHLANPPAITINQKPLTRLVAVIGQVNSISSPLRKLLTIVASVNWRLPRISDITRLDFKWYRKCVSRKIGTAWKRVEFLTSSGLLSCIMSLCFSMHRIETEHGWTRSCWTVYVRNRSTPYPAWNFQMREPEMMKQRKERRIRFQTYRKTDTVWSKIESNRVTAFVQWYV